MDTIFIRDIKVNAIIGVYPKEQQAGPQPLLIDIAFSMGALFNTAADDLKDSVDYVQLVEKMLAFVTPSRYRLIETLADRLARAMLNEFRRIEWLRLTLRKPNALTYTPQVGVIIERRRDDLAS